MADLIIPNTTKVSDTLHKSWTVQRLLNRFPLWSRARTREDSVANYILNPIGKFLDEIFETILKIRDNYYITRADLLEQPFVYTLDLPRTFEFDYEEMISGEFNYTAPVIEAVSGMETITVEVVQDSTLAAIDKSEVVPTRISCSRLLTGFSDTVVAETPIIALDTITINDSALEEIGYVFVEIDNAIQFGDRLDDGTAVEPKVIITGTPRNRTEEEEEHIIFLNNSEKRSAKRWDSISTIETHGIYDSGTLLRVHTGFDKRYVRESLGFWEDDTRETILLYTVDNVPVDTKYIPVIKFNVPEITNVALQQQALNTDTMEYEFALLMTEDTYFSDPVVAIERMPFSRWFILATQNQLCFVSARMPHPFNWTREDLNENNLISEALRSRTPSAELSLEIDRTWANLTEEGKEIVIRTRHAKPIRGIHSTRLSITYDSPELLNTVTKYYDWSGNEIDIDTDFHAGFIFNLVGLNTANNWSDKKLLIDVADTVIDHPGWVAVVKLEAKLSDGSTETDTMIVHSDFKVVEKVLDFPEELAGKVNSITYDADRRLLVRTTDNELWRVDTFWDYCFIDYPKMTVYFREEYDSVEVVS